MRSFRSFKVHYLWTAEEATNWALENHFFSIAEGLLPKPIPFVISDGSSDGGKLQQTFRVLPLFSTSIASVGCRLVVLRIKHTSLAPLALY